MIDFNERLQRLTNFLKEKQIDIGLIIDPKNVFYLTGFNSEPHERFMGLLIDVRKNESMMFVPALDQEMAKQDAIVEEIIPISDEENPFDIVSERIGNEIGTIGLETGVVTMFRHQELQRVFPDASFSNIQPKVNQMRQKKSRAEIEYLQEAVDLIEKVLAEGIKKVKIGMTEAELVGHLEFLMKKHGAVGPSFSTMVLAGEKSALPHGIPGDRAFKEGDFLLIDFGVVTKHGYCSDITRTFVIGEASEKQKEIYNIVLESNQAGIDAVRSDVPLKMFDLAARKVIDEQGYGDYFNNRIGHGLGIEVHEAPSVHEKNEEIAAPGLFFTIEPGIYIPDFGGVRIEDEVYINEEGRVEVLTSFPKKLQVLKG